MSRHLLIDTDPGIDDALAILLALSSPEARVDVITTVAGNVPIDLATANARRILAVAAPEPMPPHLLGVWKTREPRHDRNFVEIRRHYVLLGVAGLDLDVLTIEEL